MYFIVLTIDRYYLPLRLQ